MTDSIGAEQVIYGWAGTDTRKGYQIVAASGGMSEEDLRYIDQNPLPVSFVPGSFDNCIRKYLLPSGGLAYSYVKNAGRDQFGRSGVYYAHFIAVSHESWMNPAFRETGVLEQFVRDPEEAGYILHNFNQKRLELPGLQIRSQKPGSDSTANAIFENSSDMAFFLFVLSLNQYNLVLTVPRNMDAERMLVSISGILHFLPPLYWNASITTYSSSVYDEGPLFRIFIVDPSEPGSGKISGNNIIRFMDGKPEAVSGLTVPSEFIRIAELIRANGRQSLNRIWEFLASTDSNIDLITRMRYAVNEHTFSTTGDLDMALYLARWAPTPHKAAEYSGKFKSLIKTDGDFQKVRDHYTSMLKESERGEINRVFTDSVIVLSGTGRENLLANYLGTAQEVFVKFGDPFPLAEIFKTLTGKDGKPSESLADFLSRNRKSFKAYVQDHMLLAGKFKGFEQVVPVIEKIRDPEERAESVRYIFSKGLDGCTLAEKADFIKAYSQYGRMDPEVCGNMIREISKATRKSTDQSIRDALKGIIELLQSKGFTEKGSLKLKKLIGAV